MATRATRATEASKAIETTKSTKIHQQRGAHRRLPGQRTTLAALIAALCSAMPLLSHASALHSEVRDAQGTIQVDTVVRLLDQNGGELATTRTDAKGMAHFTNIAPGRYVLEAQGPTVIRTDVAVAEAPSTVVIGGDNEGGGAVQRIDVTAAHMRNARVELSPKVGTTIYAVDEHMIDTLGKGADSGFNDLLLRLPGIDQDSKASGSIHVRNDHGNVQYRINGVIVPEGISGFGEAFDTRLVQKLDFLTGALPAQYGLRTAGIIEIQTKEGDVVPGATLGLQLGTQGTRQTSAQVYGSVGDFNYYLVGDYLTNAMGIENPLPSRSALHDQTWQSKSFGNLSYFLNHDTRLGLMFGTYNGNFQIPNNPGQPVGFSLQGVSDAAAGTSLLPSSALDERQHEANRYVVLSFQQTLGALNYQVSAFAQHSELHYTPDLIGDLVYNGVANDMLRTSHASGLQLDASYKLNPTHTLRAGASYLRQQTDSSNHIDVFHADGSGNQLGNQPFAFDDLSGKLGRLASLYLQDEWHLSAPLTVNYGVRYDKVSAYVDEQQWSPRLNLFYQWNKDTAIHAGYARYFTPPPQELAAQSSINLYANTTNAPTVAQSDNVRAERTHYFDVGVSTSLNAEWNVSVDTYYKRISNLIDEGQFGQALILSPFNYETGIAKGIELSLMYNKAHWGGFLNFAYQKAQARNIVSGQALFDASRLSYIASHDVYLDHDQTYTLSGGGHYHTGDTQYNADFLYGSGMRSTGADGVPNGDHLAGHVTVNSSVSHTWKKTAIGTVEARLSLINLFDRSYLLRDGTGIGVGAPQYGARRSVFLGLSTSF